MALVRTLARPMLAAVFVAGGANALRDTPSHAKQAEPVADVVSRTVPQVPQDTEMLVRINAAVQVGAGTLFALGKFPRLSPLLLAASLVPTTAAGHRFWEEKDAGQRANQQIHLLKNGGLFGGLLFAAVAGPKRRRKSGQSAKQAGKSAKQHREGGRS